MEAVYFITPDIYYMRTRIYLCALVVLLTIPVVITAQTKKKAKKAKKEVAIQLYSVRDILNKMDNKDGKCDPAYTAILENWQKWVIPVLKQPIIIMVNFMIELPSNSRTMSSRLE